MKNKGGFSLPESCPRGLDRCQPYSQIVSSCSTSFFCCGLHNDNVDVGQDKYKMCFKGEYDDSVVYCDKRDLVHQSSVMLQAVAIIEELETV